jgi:succinate dehydrogenase / fumarate reductase cytochrome b subunit
VFGLFPGVLYHGLNGMRVVAIDFWPNLSRKQAMLWRIQIIVFVAAYVPSAILMILSMFGSH